MAPVDGNYIDDISSPTNEVIAKIPRSNAADVQKAVDCAKVAFKEYSKTSNAQRSKILSKIADCIEKNLKYFAYLESIDTGKPLNLCESLDIPRAIENFRFFSSLLISYEETSNVSMNNLNYSQRSPIGVVGLITPWNLPLYLLTWKLAPALAMGNAAIIKPSELSPLTAHALMMVIHSIEEIPKGTVNLISGYGAEVGQAIVEHPDIRLISFTGGTLTGKRVASTAAPMFKKVSLELGGKNATIVFADCDFENTVQGVLRASFLNQGQICLCGSRIFVESSIYDKFVQALLTHVKSEQWKVGNPLESSTKIGSLISRQHLEKIQSYVDLALKEGGKILCGGKQPENLLKNSRFCKGAFFEPTIIADLNPETSRVATEEIFGPVVTIHKFDTEEEVLRYHNCSCYGLAGSVWTSNISRGHRVAQQMDTGMVWVNCWLLRDLRVPFGGVKNSGIGREGGVNSFETFSEIKNICIKF